MPDSTVTPKVLQLSSPGLAELSCEQHEILCMGFLIDYLGLGGIQGKFPIRAWFFFTKNAVLKTELGGDA